MTSQNQASASLSTIIKSLGGTSNQKTAPVHLWDPPFCGDLDIIIQSDGRWDYNKTPIGRQQLVRLFASVLKREGDKYFLVTPAEKIGITVIDAPFIATEMQVHNKGHDQTLIFTTNVADTVIAGPDHNLRFALNPDGETLKPYIHIRAGLEARLSRPLYYEMANYVESHTINGQDYLGIWSQGQFFPIETLAKCQTK